jgi:hypothetical protein
MIYTDMTRKAMKIAYDAHKDQVDKNGDPYIFHPIHIAEQMDSEEATIIALLHDVVEDTVWTLEDLAQQGFSKAIISALKLLTHNNETDYLDYIWKIALSNNKYAKKVKLADLTHNSDLSRFSVVDEKTLGRVDKYRKAIEILEHNQNKPNNEQLGSFPHRRIFSLDDEGLFFLSEFSNEQRNIVMYSIDVEKANDSHYEIFMEEMTKLAGYFQCLNYTDDLSDVLSAFFKKNGEKDFIVLLDSQGIKYTPIHFDDWGMIP